jgi:phage/plasmid-associated DNA primase
MLKLLTGNDEVTFRGMYSQVVTTYVPQFKLWVLANDLPRLSKYDQGIERRMRCVHFPTRFVACPRGEHEELRDETLKEKIKGDLGWKFGFLGLLLDAAKGLDGEPLVMPAEVREFTEEYMLKNNPVGAWLRATYEITGSRGDYVQKTELYHEFLEKAESHMSQGEFSKAILKCNVGEKKLDGKHYYYGIKKLGG